MAGVVEDAAIPKEQFFDDTSIRRGYPLGIVPLELVGVSNWVPSCQHEAGGVEVEHDRVESFVGLRCLSKLVLDNPSADRDDK